MSSDLLRATTRYIFFAALVVAPWFYGGTTATSIVVIDWILGASLLLFVIELFVNRRLPTFPKSLLFVIAALLILGAIAAHLERAGHGLAVGVESHFVRAGRDVWTANSNVMGWNREPIRIVGASTSSGSSTGSTSACRVDFPPSGSP